MKLRRVLGVAAAMLAFAACSSNTAPEDGSGMTETPQFGPPVDATEVSAMGSVDLVSNLTFVVDGRRYLVHTAPTPFVPSSPDPSRTAIFKGAGGSEITATCGGATESTDEPGTQIAGPLVVSWPDHDAVVSVLSQDDTGRCSPDQERAEQLLQMAEALPRLSAEEWNQLVNDHPVDLSGSP
jgi:hypothetical protein